MNLSNTKPFQGLQEAEITSLLGCLNATTRSFQKGEVILSEGNITENIGILLSGLAVIPPATISGQYQYFGACCARICIRRGVCLHSGGADVGYGVRCGKDTSILFMNVGRVLATCTNACPFHTRLVRNLLRLSALTETFSFLKESSIPVPNPFGGG